MDSQQSETVFFDTEMKYKNKGVTYIIIAHFDNKSEYLQEKIKRLLKSEVKNICN